jgi:hypothetical protein
MEMNSILKYKSALPYREDAYMTPKINQVSNLALAKHHAAAAASRGGACASVNVAS